MTPAEKRSARHAEQVKRHELLAVWARVMFGLRIRPYGLRVLAEAGWWEACDRRGHVLTSWRRWEGPEMRSRRPHTSRTPAKLLHIVNPTPTERGTE